MKIKIASLALAFVIGSANAADLKQTDLFQALKSGKMITSFSKDDPQDYENVSWLYPSLVTGTASIFSSTLSQKPEIFATFLLEGSKFNKIPYANEITIYYDKVDADKTVLIDQLTSVTKIITTSCLGLPTSDVNKVADWAKLALKKINDPSEDGLYNIFGSVEVEIDRISSDPNTYYLSIWNKKGLFAVL